jgi:hypothetical protein
VNVHSRAIVAKQRFWHERDCLAVLTRHILDDVFIKQEIICHAGERSEGHAHFALTGCSNFVVVQVHRNTGFFHGKHETGAEGL